MRVRELSGWIPEPSGSRAKGDRVPKPGEVFIQRVLIAEDDRLLFVCTFIDHSKSRSKTQVIFYDFRNLDELTLPKIAKILQANIGKTLLSIREIEIPLD